MSRFQRIHARIELHLEGLQYVEHKKSTGEIKEGMQSIGPISTAEVVKMNDMSRRGAQMLLNRLIEKGIVEKTGVGRSTRYRLTE